jgi:hypothetical protein
MILVLSNGTSAVYKYQYVFGISATNASCVNKSILISDANLSIQNNQPSTDMPSTFSYNGNTAMLITSTTSSSTVEVSCIGNNKAGGFNYTLYTTYGWYTI